MLVLGLAYASGKPGDAVRAERRETKIWFGE